ncbi:glucose dehydrogenase [FAD, quinone]-like isoform X2 [Parasteatoda tepidariorum]|nr:glucose dehydrogenase [FAD, quinone]-like [Parasteatoda tepidariorum]XP_042895101.1 glucose dehydrogenase [FAD, quinone]-like [Parasteatoda tepidariorum]XP_042895102.1 glucose dehydrogenase [FAD, quinone]-like [Parasteatoda tepidariorum]
MYDYNITRENSYPTPLANTTLLPLMFMSLATQKNAPTVLQTPSSLHSAYDFIIVGAGSAGSTVAARLSELPCCNVLLLEAGNVGPLLNDIPGYARNYYFDDINWMYKTTPQENTARLHVDRSVNWPSGKGLGGSSLLNAMLYIRGNKKNYDDWAEDGAKGWSYEEVLPYFLKLEDERDSRYYEPEYHSTGGPMAVESPNYHPIIEDPIFEAARNMGYEIVDPNAEKQTGFVEVQGSLRNMQRWSTAKAYLVPAEHRKNLHILTNAYVTKILFQNNRAVGVSFEVNGEMYVIGAKKEVIVSAGSVKTPQLLMLSGIGPKNDLKNFRIPVVADLPVGHNLQDHCSTPMNFALDSNLETADEQFADPNITEQYINHRKGILAGPFSAVAMAFLRGSCTKPEKDFPNFELYFNSGSTAVNKALSDVLIPGAYQQIFGPYENKPFYQCIAQHLQPKSRGYVKLNSTNPYDPPIINPNYYDDPQDLRDVVEGLRVCYKIGTSRAMRKIGSKPFATVFPGCERFSLNSDEYFACMARSLALTISHYVGTAKMGAVDDPRTVVDPQLKVKGIRGLRVVDASVFPILTSGNTNTPTIMVAEKAADMIKASTNC